jgi:hypothetical protein
MPRKRSPIASSPGLGKVWESMSCDRGTRNHTSNSNHGKTSILQFTQLIFSLLSRISGVKTQRIESKVSWETIVFVHVSKRRETASFKEGDPTEDLNHRFRQGVVGINNLRESFERELSSRNTEEFWQNKSNSGQHCRSAVLEFGLAKPWEPLRGTLAS